MSHSVARADWGETAHRFANSTALSAAIAALVVLPISLAAIDGYPVGVAHDDGMYTVLAKSLATGHGYRWINLPGEPRATHYPPGYPAVLAVVWHFFPAFPGNVVVFKVLNAVLLTVAAAFVVVFARRRLALSSQGACLATIAGCAAVPVLVLSNLVMSEMLFLALLMPALLVAEQMLDDETHTTSNAVVVALVGGLLLLVRTHGIAFVIAVGAALLLRRRLRALAAFIGATLVVAYPWYRWQTAHHGVVPVPLRGDYDSYSSWFAAGARGHAVSFLGRTIAATSREIFAMFGAVTAAGIPSAPIRLFTVMVAIALLFIGLWRLHRQAQVTSLFIAAYIAVLLVWPFTPARFMWAIWPLLVIAFVAGALAIKEWEPPATWLQSARVALALGAVLTVGGYATYNVRGYGGRWWSSIARNTAGVAAPTVNWVAAHTAPSALVSTNAELMVYLYTGRLAVPATRFLADDYFRLPSADSRADALRSIMQSYRIDAIAIIANDSLEIAARRMSAEPNPALSLRDSVPGGLIFSPTHR